MMENLFFVWARTSTSKHCSENRSKNRSESVTAAVAREGVATSIFDQSDQSAPSSATPVKKSNGKLAYLPPLFPTPCTHPTIQYETLKISPLPYCIGEVEPRSEFDFCIHPRVKGLVRGRGRAYKPYEGLAKSVV